MNVTKFLLGTVVGGIVYLLLGWLVYGILFTNIYPPSENENMLFMVLGSLSYGALLSYIFNKWAGISTWATGVKAGAIIGFLAALWMNFFMYSGMPEVNYQNFILDVVLNIGIGAIVGAGVAMVSGREEAK